MLETGRIPVGGFEEITCRRLLYCATILLLALTCAFSSEDGSCTRSLLKDQLRKSFKVLKLGHTRSIKSCITLCCRKRVCDLALFNRDRCFGISCSHHDLCRGIANQLRNRRRDISRRSVSDTDDQGFDSDFSYRGRSYGYCRQRRVVPHHVFLHGGRGMSNFRKLSNDMTSLRKCNQRCCEVKDCSLGFIMRDHCYGVMCPDDSDCDSKEDTRVPLHLEIALVKRGLRSEPSIHDRNSVKLKSRRKSEKQHHRRLGSTEIINHKSNHHRRHRGKHFSRNRLDISSKPAIHRHYKVSKRPHVARHSNRLAIKRFHHKKYEIKKDKLHSGERRKKGGKARSGMHHRLKDMDGDSNDHSEEKEKNKDLEPERQEESLDDEREDLDYSLEKTTSDNEKKEGEFRDTGEPKKKRKHKQHGKHQGDEEQQDEIKEDLNGGMKEDDEMNQEKIHSHRRKKYYNEITSSKDSADEENDRGDERAHDATKKNILHRKINRISHRYHSKSSFDKDEMDDKDIDYENDKTNGDSEEEAGVDDERELSKIEQRNHKVKHRKRLRLHFLENDRSSKPTEAKSSRKQERHKSSYNQHEDNDAGDEHEDLTKYKDESGKKNHSSKTRNRKPDTEDYDYGRNRRRSRGRERTRKLKKKTEEDEMGHSYDENSTEEESRHKERSEKEGVRLGNDRERVHDSDDDDNTGTDTDIRKRERTRKEGEQFITHNTDEKVDFTSRNDHSHKIGRKHHKVHAEEEAHENEENEDDKVMNSKEKINKKDDSERNERNEDNDEKAHADGKGNHDIRRTYDRKNKNENDKQLHEKNAMSRSDIDDDTDNIMSQNQKKSGRKYLHHHRTEEGHEGDDEGERGENENRKDKNVLEDQQNKRGTEREKLKSTDKKERDRNRDDDEERKNDNENNDSMEEVLNENRERFHHHHQWTKTDKEEIGESSSKQAARGELNDKEFHKQRLNKEERQKDEDKSSKNENIQNDEHKSGFRKKKGRLKKNQADEKYHYSDDISEDDHRMRGKYPEDSNERKGHRDTKGEGGEYSEFNEDGEGSSKYHDDHGWKHSKDDSGRKDGMDNLHEKGRKIDNSDRGHDKQDSSEQSDGRHHIKDMQFKGDHDDEEENTMSQDGDRWGKTNIENRMEESDRHENSRYSHEKNYRDHKDTQRDKNDHSYHDEDNSDHYGEKKSREYNSSKGKYKGGHMEHKEQWTSDEHDFRDKEHQKHENELDKERVHSKDLEENSDTQKKNELKASGNLNSDGKVNRDNHLKGTKGGERNSYANNRDHMHGTKDLKDFLGAEEGHKDDKGSRENSEDYNDHGETNKAETGQKKNHHDDNRSRGNSDDHKYHEETHLDKTDHEENHHDDKGSGENLKDYKDHEEAERDEIRHEQNQHDSKSNREKFRDNQSHEWTHRDETGHEKDHNDDKRNRGYQNDDKDHQEEKQADVMSREDSRIGKENQGHYEDDDGHRREHKDNNGIEKDHEGDQESKVIGKNISSREDYKDHVGATDDYKHKLRNQDGHEHNHGDKDKDKDKEKEKEKENEKENEKEKGVGDREELERKRGNQRNSKDNKRVNDQKYENDENKNNENRRREEIKPRTEDGGNNTAREKDLDGKRHIANKKKDENNDATGEKRTSGNGENGWKEGTEKGKEDKEKEKQELLLTESRKASTSRNKLDAKVGLVSRNISVHHSDVNDERYDTEEKQHEQEKYENKWIGNFIKHDWDHSNEKERHSSGKMEAYNQSTDNGFHKHNKSGVFPVHKKSLYHSIKELQGQRNERLEDAKGGSTSTLNSSDVSHDIMRLNKNYSVMHDVGARNSSNVERQGDKMKYFDQDMSEWRESNKGDDVDVHGKYFNQLSRDWSMNRPMKDDGEYFHKLTSGWHLINESRMSDPGKYFNQRTKEWVGNRENEDHLMRSKQNHAKSALKVKSHRANTKTVLRGFNNTHRKLQNTTVLKNNKSKLHEKQHLGISRPENFTQTQHPQLGSKQAVSHKANKKNQTRTIPNFPQIHEHDRSRNSTMTGKYRSKLNTSNDTEHFGSKSRNIKGKQNVKYNAKIGHKVNDDESSKENVKNEILKLLGQEIEQTGSRLTNRNKTDVNRDSQKNGLRATSVMFNKNTSNVMQRTIVKNSSRPALIRTGFPAQKTPTQKPKHKVENYHSPETSHRLQNKNESLKNKSKWSAGSPNNIKEKISGTNSNGARKVQSKQLVKNKPIAKNRTRGKLANKHKELGSADFHKQTVVNSHSQVGVLKPYKTNYTPNRNPETHQNSVPTITSKTSARQNTGRVSQTWPKVYEDSWKQRVIEDSPYNAYSPTSSAVSNWNEPGNNWNKQKDVFENEWKNDWQQYYGHTNAQTPTTAPISWWNNMDWYTKGNINPQNNINTYGNAGTENKDRIIAPTPAPVYQKGEYPLINNDDKSRNYDKYWKSGIGNSGVGNLYGRNGQDSRSYINPTAGTTPRRNNVHETSTQKVFPVGQNNAQPLAKPGNSNRNVEMHKVIKPVLNATTLIPKQRKSAPSHGETISNINRHPNQNKVPTGGTLPRSDQGKPYKIFENRKVTQKPLVPHDNIAKPATKKLGVLTTTRPKSIKIRTFPASGSKIKVDQWGETNSTPGIFNPFEVNKIEPLHPDSTRNLTKPLSKGNRSQTKIPKGCFPGEIMSEMTLANGLDAGNYTKIGRTELMDSCISKCCDIKTCEVAIQMDDVCFAIKCHSKETCKIKTTLGKLSHHKLCFISRGKKERNMNDFDNDLLGTQDTCPGEQAVGLRWRKTIAGNFDEIPCPKKAKGLARRKCSVESKWLSPDFSTCVTNEYEELYQTAKRLVYGEDLSSLLQSLAVVTTRTIDNSLIFGGDLKKTTEIITSVVQEQGVKQDGAITQQDLKNFLVTCSNLLDDSNKQEWKNIQKKTRGTADILRNSQTFALLASPKFHENQDNATFVTNNIMLQINHQLKGSKVAEFPDYTNPDIAMWDGEKDKLKLPASVFSIGDTKVVSFSYKTLPALLPVETNEHFRHSEPNSKILACIIEPAILDKITPPITITLHHLKENRINPKCVFWDFNLNPSHGGAWSSKGCWLERSDKRYSVCRCDHLGNFAVLMDAVDGRAMQATTKDLQYSRKMAAIWICVPVSIVIIIGALYTVFAWSRGPRLNPKTLNEKSSLLRSSVTTQYIRYEHNSSPSRHVYAECADTSPKLKDLEWQLELRNRIKGKRNNVFGSVSYKETVAEAERDSGIESNDHDDSSIPCDLSLSQDNISVDEESMKDFRTEKENESVNSISEPEEPRASTPNLEESVYRLQIERRIFSTNLRRCIGSNNLSKGSPT